MNLTSLHFKESTLYFHVSISFLFHKWTNMYILFESRPVFGAPCKQTFAQTVTAHCGAVHCYFIHDSE